MLSSIKCHFVYNFLSLIITDADFRKRTNGMNVFKIQTYNCLLTLGRSGALNLIS